MTSARENAELREVIARLEKQLADIVNESVSRLAEIASLRAELARMPPEADAMNNLAVRILARALTEYGDQRAREARAAREPKP